GGRGPTRVSAGGTAAGGTPAAAGRPGVTRPGAGRPEATGPARTRAAGRARGVAPASGTGPASGPDVASLAIPGYDSLSASQVVQRLDGLSPDELEAVRRYEADGRGRRTILARVTQLQNG
ncbi:MAG TPA: hypothetical protein VKV25_06515, partial [Acidimicrobiales bacterium]|nr:hypothetical protein [Acidimicrobiales bacterium]